MTLKITLVGKNSILSQKQKAKVIYSVIIIEGYLLHSSSVFFFTICASCVPNYDICAEKRKYNLLTYILVLVCSP